MLLMRGGKDGDLEILRCSQMWKILQIQFSHWSQCNISPLRIAFEFLYFYHAYPCFTLFTTYMRLNEYPYAQTDKTYNSLSNLVLLTFVQHWKSPVSPPIWHYWHCPSLPFLILLLRDTLLFFRWVPVRTSESSYFLWSCSKPSLYSLSVSLCIRII